MADQEKTSWKKNLDSNFISGDDLRQSIRGFKPEMNVSISRFSDQESFDKNKQAKSVVTGLFLKDEHGKELYKPMALNRTNAKFLEKECGSPFMEDWIGQTVVLYAVPDSRFGFVARFKKFAKPVLTIGDKNFLACRAAYLADPKKLDVIKAKYILSQDAEKELIKPEPAKK